MTSRFVRAAVVIAAALLSVQATAQDFFLVDFEIKVNGEKIANPTITTREKTLSKMTLSSPNGDSYELSLLVESMAGDQVKLAIDFRSEKFGNASPTLIVRAGQQATFSTGYTPNKMLEIKIVASPNKS